MAFEVDFTQVFPFPSKTSTKFMLITFPIASLSVRFLVCVLVHQHFIQRGLVLFSRYLSPFITALCQSQNDDTYKSILLATIFYSRYKEKRISLLSQTAEITPKMAWLDLQRNVIGIFFGFVDMFLLNSLHFCPTDTSRFYFGLQSKDLGFLEERGINRFVYLY